MLNYFTVLPVWPAVILGIAVLFLFYYEIKRALYYTSRLPLNEFYRLLWLKGTLPPSPVSKRKGCRIDVFSIIIWISGFIILNKNTDYLSLLEVFICSLVLLILPWILRMVFRLCCCMLLLIGYLASFCFKD